MGRSLAVLARDLEACDRHRFGNLGDIRCPVAVVAGEGDRMTPARAARDLVDALPDARLVVMPGVGHDLVLRSHRTVTEVIGQVRDLVFG
jgi:pimeloyl-ACP methyl ester carboxylesterase